MALCVEHLLTLARFEAALADLERGRALIQRHGGRGFQDTEAAAEVFYNLGVCYSVARRLRLRLNGSDGSAKLGPYVWAKRRA